MINSEAIQSSTAGEHEPQVITLEVTYKAMKNYNYVLVDQSTRKAVIVDPAWEMDKIESALKEANAQLEGVLLTHSHPDHVHLARAVSAKYCCPVWMSKQEVLYSGFTADRLVEIDSSEWSVGAMTIKPILTPGHTPGCICYLVGSNLFTGDVLFAEGCGLCPGLESAYEMFESLAELKRRIDPQTRVYPGHCYGKLPGRQFAELLRENIYLQFRDRDSFAAFRLRKGQNTKRLLAFK